MQKVRIRVTKSDIKNGVCKDCENCAVALACRRVVNRFQCVSDEYLELKGKSPIELPFKVQQFINKFDKNKEAVQPFSFTLTLPNKYVKNANIKN